MCLNKAIIRQQFSISFNNLLTVITLKNCIRWISRLALSVTITFAQITFFLFFHFVLCRIKLNCQELYTLAWQNMDLVSEPMKMYDAIRYTRTQYFLLYIVIIIKHSIWFYDYIKNWRYLISFLNFITFCFGKCKQIPIYALIYKYYK